MRYNKNNNNNLRLSGLHTYHYNHTVNIQQAVTQDRNGTAQTWSVCNNGITQFYLPPMHEPYLWLVLIAPTHEGMARLSWPGWLVTYRDKCHTLGIEPMVTHPSTNWARCRLSLLIKANMPTTMPDHHHYLQLEK